MTRTSHAIHAACLAPLVYAQSAGASPARVGGLIIDDPRPQEGAPALVAISGWSEGPEFARPIAMTGAASVESRAIAGSSYTVVFEFDHPVIAFRRAAVEGGVENATFFSPGQRAIAVEVGGVEDASRLAVALVDVVSETGKLAYAEARVGVLAGDLSENGELDTPDINAFVRAFVVDGPEADLDLNGSIDPGDIELFIDWYMAGAGPLENLAPTIDPVPPQHATPGGVSRPADLIIRDDLTPTDALEITVTSGDASIVSPEDVMIEVAGDARTLRFRGGDGAAGSTTLTVRASDGVRTGETTFLATVAPDQAPTTIIDSSTYLGVAPLTVEFDASESQDPQDNITRYSWRFGDGTRRRGVRATHTFAAPGHYVVECTARDASGLEHTATRVVTVAPQAYAPGGAVSEAEARRFLWQAAFGPSDDDASFVMDNGFEAWIDAQFAAPASYITEDLVAQLGEIDGRWEDPSDIWEDHCVHGPDQLRQRLAWALVQIIAIRPQGGREDLYNLYVKNALGDAALDRSGNYREMLMDITYNAEMGDWLTYAWNRKEDPVLGTKPDENYAREIMQLFTIGLWLRELDGRLQHDVFGDPIPTYDPQEDIAQFARIFTGMYRDWPEPVMAVSIWDHEFGDKQLLDYPGAVPAFGYVPASDQDELNIHADIDAAIDNLFHHPSMAPFIAELLIKRMVTSNPTHAYIGRVAEAFEGSGPYGSGVRGDLRAAAKAILLDDEARNPAYRDNPYYGKVREPIVALFGASRALGIVHYPGEAFPFRMNFDTGGSWIGNQLGQRWLGTPSVFNFYQPDYAPLNTALSAGGFTAPELQILDDVTAVTVVSRFGWDIAGDQDAWDAGTLAYMMSLAQTPAVLVDELDLVLNAGATGAEAKQIIAAALEEIPRDEWRVGAAVQLLMSGPGFRVQR